jgi:hypothetical protein
MRSPVLGLAVLGLLACPEPAPPLEDVDRSTWTTWPGASEPDDLLVEDLLAGLDALGPEYVPRTHHLRPGGAPVYTNRLVHEPSPYLRQHAHNPVDWRPWGDEAFAEAARRGVPVLLSIGYSTCHWCHVMERESFEDLEIAGFLNEHFVAIKVDREERPDVDAVYIAAVRALSGRSGWPLTAVLTPDREPFFGGTYFPARDGDRGRRQGFLTLLGELQVQYRDDREGVIAKAAEVSRKVRASSGSRAGRLPGTSTLVRGAESFAADFDGVNGGFSKRKKFPRPTVLDFLLRYHRRTGDPGAWQMVDTTLKQMAAGGIHDQLGGGFHRYTVEPTWLVPHFEKMLYDKAQLASTYLDASVAGGVPAFAAVGKRTLDYVVREMTHPSGGFYSATDADSPDGEGHPEEGLFFTWTPAEVRDLLEPDAALRFESARGIQPGGNFEGRSILTARRSLLPIARQSEMSVEALEAELEASRTTLYASRATRQPPGLDNKVLTGWNGLMISAFVRGAVVLRDPAYLQGAEAAADFVWKELRRDGRLLRSWQGTAHEAGTLEDYAFFGAALIDLFEATGEPLRLQQALVLQEVLAEHFYDAAAGGFFATADDGETLIARQKPLRDGAIPSGNSVVARNLLRLAALTGREDLRTLGEGTIAAFAGTLVRSPTTAPAMLSALDFVHEDTREVVLVAPKSSAQLDPLRGVLAHQFLPNLVVAETVLGDDVASLVPWVAQRPAQRGLPTAYVCERQVCQLPTTDPAEFARQLTVSAPFDGPAPPALTPASKPRPYTYDAARNRHWDPKHGHWHDGPPAQNSSGAVRPIP